MKRKQLTLSLAAAAVLAVFNPAQAQTVNANGIANSDVNAGVDVTAQPGAPGTQSGQTQGGQTAHAATANPPSADINSSSAMNQGATQSESSSASGNTAQQGAPGTQSGPHTTDNSSVAANQQSSDMKDRRYY